MDSRIQGIIEKIYQDGIDRAGQDAEKILNQAHQKAEIINAEAKQKAARIIQDAEKASLTIKEASEAELKLASLRTLANLRKKIENSLSLILLEGKMEELSFDTDFLKEMMLAIAKNWKENSESTDVEVLLPESLKTRFEDTFRKGIEETLDGLTIEFSDQLSSGFRISKKGSGYFLDFSDKALLEFFRPFLHKKT